MNKRDRLLSNQLVALKENGWVVNQEDAVRFNEGSETLAHLHAKTVTAKVLKDQGYRVDTEVVMPNGEVDVLGYSEQDMIVVECESNPDSNTFSSKLNRYVHDQPPREMFWIDVDAIPGNIGEAYQHITEEIFE